VRAVGTWVSRQARSTSSSARDFCSTRALAASVGPVCAACVRICALATGWLPLLGRGGSRLPTSAGYGYIEAAFGPLVGYVAGLCCGLATRSLRGVSAALADVVVACCLLRCALPRTQPSYERDRHDCLVNIGGVDAVLGSSMPPPY